MATVRVEEAYSERDETIDALGMRWSDRKSLGAIWGLWGHCEGGDAFTPR